MQGLDELKYYAERSVIKHGANPADGDLLPGKDVVVGRFVHKERPTFLQSYEQQILDKQQFVKPKAMREERCRRGSADRLDHPA